MDLCHIVALCILILQKKGPNPEIRVLHTQKVTFSVHIISGRSDSLNSLAELLYLWPVEVCDARRSASFVLCLEGKATLSSLLNQPGHVWQVGHGLVHRLRECEDAAPINMN